MKIAKIIYSGMLVLFCTSISFGQNLAKHEWKHRVLIITSKDTTQLQQQVGLLIKNVAGLQERKLAIYQVTPEGYAQGTKRNNWTRNTEFYTDIKKTKKSFEIILMGLDGGVKLRQTKLLTLEKLFALIDGMPMQRAEMRKND